MRYTSSELRHCGMQFSFSLCFNMEGTFFRIFNICIFSLRIIPLLWKEEKYRIYQMYAVVDIQTEVCVYECVNICLFIYMGSNVIHIVRRNKHSSFKKKYVNIICHGRKLFIFSQIVIFKISKYQLAQNCNLSSDICVLSLYLRSPFPNVLTYLRIFVSEDYIFGSFASYINLLLTNVVLQHQDFLFFSKLGISELVGCIL